MAGRSQSPFNGAPLIFRDGQAASRNFKVSSQVAGVWRNTALIPKPKFLFFVEFVVPNNSPDLGLFNNISDTGRLSDTKDGIVFQVKQIDKPRFNMRTETMSQYNKKRVIQTRIDYQPFTINFHDDVGDKVLKFWERYFEFYYGDGSHDDAIDWQEDKVSNEFREGGNEAGWGYRGRFSGSGGANNMHFFESIDIFEFYGGEFTKIRFIHPKISSLDHDSNDYADGGTGQGIRMTFEYEGVIYDTDRKPLTPELINKFGFLSEYKEIDGSQPTELTTGLGTNKQIISDPSSGVSPSSETPTTGVDRLRESVRRSTNSESVAGSSTIGGQGFSFGTNSINGVGNSNTDLVTLVGLNNGNPSPDLIQKQTGITNQTDNFGRSRQTPSPIQNIPTSPNSGIDGTLVSSAASQLSINNQNREVTVGEGQTQIVGQETLTEFSRTLGTAAVIGQREGLISSVSKKVDSPQSNEANSDVFVDKFDDGSIMLTDRGSGVTNATRGKESVLGSRREGIVWTSDRVVVDPVRKGLSAERNTDFNE